MRSSVNHDHDDTIAEFNDPRLVAIYDSVNTYEPGTEPDFYTRLAAELDVKTIIDIGCGTGLITCTLASRGYQLIGVEPSKEMLDVARRRCGDQVQWVEGDVSQLGKPNVDLAIMTGHVAQFFIADESWSAALSAIHTALRPGGRLAFESRNPAAREWEAWTRDARRTVSDPKAGKIETWTEVDEVQGEVVSCVDHYLFAATGDELMSCVKLRFRTESELTQSLERHGFDIEHVYGDWDARPANPSAPELIVVAVRS